MNNERTEFERFELVNFCEIDESASKSYCAVHGVSPKLNLGDIEKIDENQIDDCNVIFGGSPCFPYDEEVLTKQGYKPIGEVTVGDEVLTHKNRFKKVLRVGGEKEKDIYVLKAQGILPIRTTENHPFYVRHKIHKWDSKTNKYVSHFSEPSKVRVDKIKKGDYIGIPILNTSENPNNLTKEECWILGRYVADGCIKDKYILLYIGKDKKEDVKNIKTKKYIFRKTSKSCYSCFVKDPRLFEFVTTKIKYYAINKNIPMEILNLPVELLSSFLDGYFSGDGCRVGQHIQATTTSRELAIGLCMAVQKVYRVGCRVYFEKRPETQVIEGRTVKQHDTYMIRFAPDMPERHLYTKIDDIIWYPVRSVEKTGKTENVYNLEVEEDHTYTVKNCIVSNCQDFSIAGRQEGAEWHCKDCDERYNPLTVHYSERKYCPKCHSKNIEKTRSSLLVEWLRIVRAKKPNWGIYENVPAIVQDKFSTTFNMFLDELREYGYNVYFDTLNARKYGVPQNRNRLYLVFIKREVDNEEFFFPAPFYNGLTFRDFLEENVDKKYYISEDTKANLIKSLQDKYIIDKSQGNLPTHLKDYLKINKSVICASRGRYVDNKKKTTKQHLEPNLFDYTNTITTVQKDNLLLEMVEKDKRYISNLGNKKYIQKAYIKFFEKNGRVPKFFNPYDVREYNDYSPTLTTHCGSPTCKSAIVVKEKDYALRSLTPSECWALMGFTKEQCDRAEKAGVPKTQLYKQAGNSIVVDVLYYLILSLYRSNPKLFNNLKVSSFFTGIGAFEQALEEVLEDECTPKVGSMFAGVGGICLGFQNAKYDRFRYSLEWANEIDDYACETYRTNFSHNLIQGDICKILNPCTKEDKKLHKKILSKPIDVLTAGFPCQPFSVAGEQKGFSDKRGNMFFMITKLIEELDQKFTKPRVVFLENVSNLLSHNNGQTFSSMKSELEKLGYIVFSQILNTMDYSDLPQNRKRLYIVAFSNKEDAEHFTLFTDKELQKEKKNKSYLDRVEDIKKVIDYSITKKEKEKYYYTKEKYTNLFSDDKINLDKEITDMYKFYQCRRGKYIRENKNDVCPTLTANMGTGGHNVPLIKVNDGIRKLMPEETFTLQGFPINTEYFLPEMYKGKKYPDSQLYKQSGNAVSVPIITLIAENILKSFE